MCIYIYIYTYIYIYIYASTGPLRPGRMLERHVYNHRACLQSQSKAIQEEHNEWPGANWWQTIIPFK